MSKALKASECGHLFLWRILAAHRPQMTEPALQRYLGNAYHEDCGCQSEWLLVKALE